MTGAAEAVPSGAIRLRISGHVQGVGFRPFVHRLATGLGLSGWVRNTGGGVECVVGGGAKALETFRRRVIAEAPSGAEIGMVRWEATGDRVGAGFRILASADADVVGEAVPLDAGICEACLGEMLDPSNRRHRHPFISCVACGPRHTILESMPYDRERTSMRGFPMCGACEREYWDPEDRRFHAQPICCPACGPHLEFWAGDGGKAWGDDALERAVGLVRGGGILALKGVGGFQLVVDASNEAAVRRLRERKRRPDKPFAVMFRTLDEIRSEAEVGEVEASALGGPARPVVLLVRRPGGVCAGSVAPGLPWLGAFLPATALHRLLLDGMGGVAVVTSGNVAGERLCATNEEALERLAGIADGFLMHDRAVVHAMDDSVVRVMDGEVVVLRCARGLAPHRVPVDGMEAGVLGVGGEMKNAVALSGPGCVWLGPHVGELDTVSGEEAHRLACAELERCVGGWVGTVALDRHPDSVAGRGVEARAAAGVRRVRVWHHVAHGLACMAENGVDGPVLAVCWDGTGFGADGTVWGGEFLRIEGGRWERVASLRRFRLPGGDVAAREPWRCLAGVLHAMGGLEAARDVFGVGLPAGALRVVETMLERGVRSPWCSSAGRLFDAVSALLGVRSVGSYEGQAAMELEALAMGGGEGLGEGAGAVGAPRIEGGVLDWEPLVRGMVGALELGVERSGLAAGFHRALACGIVEVARSLGIRDVCLTGGCFQNALLLGMTAGRLRDAGFRVHRHRRVPPNDGGLALGQVIAAWRGID